MRIFSCHVGRLRLPRDDDSGESRGWTRTAWVIFADISTRLISLEDSAVWVVVMDAEDNGLLIGILEEATFCLVGLGGGVFVRISKEWCCTWLPVLDFE